MADKPKTRRGSNITKGMRPGGRDRGTPNKATTERAEIARLQTEQSQRKGLKLGKELLEDFAHLFAGMAASYQPWPVVMGKNPNESEEKFLTYARLTVDTAKALAEYQSPKFRAIMVTAPADQLRDVTPPGSNVLPMSTDATALARVYQNMVKRVG